MATLSAATLVFGVAAVARPPSQAQGLPQLRVMRAEKVRCGAAHPRRPSQQRDGSSVVVNGGKAAPAVGGASSSLLAVASAMTTTTSPALALVDERMSTEGTGLSLGLSNNLLGWILLGVFGLIWSLYTVYTSTLDEDEDSGLSL